MSRPLIAMIVGFGVLVGLPSPAHAQATAKPEFIWNQQEREAFVVLIAPLLSRVDSMTINEVFVTGTEWESAVMIKRCDKIGGSAGAALAGRTVTVAAFFRVKNRRITEWLDAPVTAPTQAAR